VARPCAVVVAAVADRERLRKARAAQAARVSCA